MGKNSQKQLVEQLMQWIPTVIKKRDKRVKSRNTGQRKAYKR